MLGKPETGARRVGCAGFGDLLEPFSGSGLQIAKLRLLNPVSKDLNHQILPQGVGCRSAKQTLPFGA